MANNYDGLDGPFSIQLQGLINASNGRIWLNSGFRTKERQQQLWDRALLEHPNDPGKWVAKPGSSNHEFGLAADLGGDLKLAHQLAPQFGLVFPMPWEAWHIEPPYARGKRGAGYQAALTTPPDGYQGVSTEPQDQMGYQMYVMSELLKGRDPASIQGELSGAAPTEGTAPVAPAAPGESGGTAPAPGAPVEGGSLEDKFLSFVRQHESGGNYRSPSGPGHWAGGAYQVMRDTWHGYGGYAKADDAPPEVQDQFAKGLLSSIKEALGTNDPGLWAAAWYLGTGGARQWMQSGMDPNFSPPENHGFKVSSYAQEARAATGWQG